MTEAQKESWITITETVFPSQVVIPPKIYWQKIRDSLDRTVSVGQGREPNSLSAIFSVEADSADSAADESVQAVTRILSTTEIPYVSVSFISAMRVDEVDQTIDQLGVASADILPFPPHH